jgi:hypothetical protein
MSLQYGGFQRIPHLPQHVRRLEQFLSSLSWLQAELAENLRVQEDLLIDHFQPDFNLMASTYKNSVQMPKLLDEIQTKVLRVFLLAIHSLLYSFVLRFLLYFFKLPQPLTVSIVRYCTV